MVIYFTVKEQNINKGKQGMKNEERATLFDVIRKTGDSLHFNSEGKPVITLMREHGKEGRKHYLNLKDYKIEKSMEFILVLSEIEPHGKTITQRVQDRLAKVNSQ